MQINENDLKLRSQLAFTKNEVICAVQKNKLQFDHSLEENFLVVEALYTCPVVE